ncbi:uncharacterized protein EAF01_003281 [Botrytis porri]|uniref:uncharacterized protein n=1 Tax=Botrytis porri TaxID=87229 RepID=UPI0019021E77|nr:uncharacterized protein EAF01_003281 [Botrytis porri]KAF7909563.1 hypothetical protein EAF01_003281 [Botrytis porri]
MFLKANSENIRFVRTSTGGETSQNHSRPTRENNGSLLGDRESANPFILLNGSTARKRDLSDTSSFDPAIDEAALKRPARRNPNLYLIFHIKKRIHQKNFSIKDTKHGLINRVIHTQYAEEKESVLPEA